ncbi:hypothetical protein N7471_010039 [Penicillium samsonianum]|uniref:uncharacterized protein n=1 Tax=Penicillium samsonianum TaxID=1882272 RepID=UPI0025476413|nr:uncharacterized protein N7471_010039 [Penicillium samsonianum]KAJ6128822.1 hypothetical protein N7471_010039 [Penicillium samsonianum]
MAKLLDVLIHCNQGKVVEQQVCTLTKTDLGPGHWGIPVGVLTPNRDIGAHPATVDGALLYYRLVFANLDVASSVRLNLSDVNYTTWEKYRLWDARLQRPREILSMGAKHIEGEDVVLSTGPQTPSTTASSVNSRAPMNIRTSP